MSAVHLQESSPLNRISHRSSSEWVKQIRSTGNFRAGGPIVHQYSDMKKQRIFIYSSDLMVWTGKSKRSCQSLLARIRHDLGKQPHQQITVYEYCRYMDLDPDDLLPLD